MGCGASVATPIGKSYRPLETKSVIIQTDGVFREHDYDFDEDKDEDETETSDKAPLVARKTKNVRKSHTNRHDPQNIEDIWLAVCETLDVPKGQHSTNRDLIVKRSGWKTIRIFVSSTFKDFHHERETLVKEVFPDLRVWCEARRLHLVECDLRWGVPKDSTTESTLRTCLGEIDRCYADNVMPYFLNMTSQRIGWIPSQRDVPLTIVEEYRWIFGLSMTEMEIVHGAYRKDNPNSLFMMRDDSFIDTVPEEYRRIFVDESPLARPKLKVLKEQIGDRFPEKRIVNYGCKFLDADPQTKKVHLEMDETFKTTIFEFFKDRINKQYPLEKTTMDPYQQMRVSHEAFMKSKSDQVLGRQDILDEIFKYVSGGGKDVPLLVLGGPGSGKSSILAKIADITEAKALEKALPNGGNLGWHVFYHFVGAVPGSTELEPTLKRLLKEMEVVTDATMPIDLDSACQLVCGALSNQFTRPTVIFVDALNQFYEEMQALSMLWIPRKLPSNIRVVLSMIPDTAQHKALMSRESKPDILEVNPLDLKARMIIIRDVLGRYNKTLDLDQMVTLLAKESTANPLWLSIACEELRVFGEFHQISEKVDSLKDGLLELLGQVLTRFEKENGGHLLVATLCLLEVSETGLLESEFLSILADEDNLMPPADFEEKGEKEKPEKAKPMANEAQLPAYKWATVYRALRPFLRPYGDSGEGRLDFYHRSLSKAVRKKYFKVNAVDEESDMTKHLYKWWHMKLANYFEFSDKLDRRVEEYPYHLKAIGDDTRMTRFLCEDYTMERLYKEDYSSLLISFWREGGGGLKSMEDKYRELVMNFANSPNVDKAQLALKYEHIARLLIQVSAQDVSKEFAQKALEMETEQLGSRPERLVEIYTLLNQVYSEICKHKYEFMTRDMIPLERETLSYARKAFDIRNTMKSDQNQHKLAKLLVSMSFSLSAWIDVGGDTDLTIDDARTEANGMVEQAITIFTQLKDIGNLADATMNKALLLRSRYNSEQLKYYNQAMELCQQAYGEYSHLTARIYLNNGIYYEDIGDYGKAFDLFYKNYQVRIIFNGLDHPNTKKALGIIQEPAYQRVAVGKGITLPTMET